MRSGGSWRVRRGLSTKKKEGRCDRGGAWRIRRGIAIKKQEGRCDEGFVEDLERAFDKKIKKEGKMRWGIRGGFEEDLLQKKEEGCSALSAEFARDRDTV